jgi:hypothetical protein
MNLKDELIRLINESDVFSVANALQKIAAEESDHDFSPNGMKARGPIAVNNFRVLSLHLSGALDEMDEVVRKGSEQ